MVPLHYPWRAWGAEGFAEMFNREVSGCSYNVACGTLTVKRAIRVQYIHASYDVLQQVRDSTHKQNNRIVDLGKEQLFTKGINTLKGNSTGLPTHLEYPGNTRARTLAPVSILHHFKLISSTSTWYC